MKKIIVWLQGKKTEGVVILALILTLCHYLGWIDSEFYRNTMTVLGFGAFVTLGARIKRLTK